MHEQICLLTHIQEHCAGLNLSALVMRWNICIVDPLSSLIDDLFNKNWGGLLCKAGGMSSLKENGFSSQGVCILVRK